MSAKGRGSNSTDRPYSICSTEFNVAPYLLPLLPAIFLSGLVLTRRSGSFIRSQEEISFLILLGEAISWPIIPVLHSMCKEQEDVYDWQACTIRVQVTGGYRPMVSVINYTQPMATHFVIDLLLFPLDSSNTDAGVQMRIVLEPPHHTEPSIATVGWDTTNSDIVHSFFEGKPDIVEAPQVPQIREGCFGFCDSWCDLFPTAFTSCSPALQVLKANHPEHHLRPNWRKLGLWISLDELHWGLCVESCPWALIGGAW